MIEEAKTAPGGGQPGGKRSGRAADAADAQAFAASAAGDSREARQARRRWLAAQGQPGRRFFLAAGFADAAATAGTILLSWYAAALIVATVGAAAGTAGRGLVGDAVGVVAGGLLRAAALFAADRLAAAGAQRVEASVRDKVLDALVLGDPAGEQVSPGVAVAAVSEQIPRLGDLYRGYQRRAIAACAAPVIILAVTFPTNWVVGVLLVAATPIVPANMAVTGLGAEAVSRRQMEQVAQLSGQVLERLQTMGTLRSLGAIGQQRRLVERAASELAQRTVAVLRVAFLASSALEWVSTFAIGMVAMYVGATLLGYVLVPGLPSHLGAREGVFVLLLAPAYFAPLRRFAAAYHQRQEAAAAADILEPLTRRATGTAAAAYDAVTAPVSSAPVSSAPVLSGRRAAPVASATSATSAAAASATPAAVGSVPLAAAVAGVAAAGAEAASVRAPDVTLRDVTVRFPGRPLPALGGVSLFVPPRSIVGVAGPSGSGKSTLLKVAGGWLTASDGQALIGGCPAGEHRALLIGQHPYLFSGSLADNVSLGRPGISRDQIWAAIEAAQLAELAARLPDGLDTILGERGWGISGGEAQRLALARAFASDAPLVLVDEPTAHLDAATEAALIEPLTRLLKGRTALVATHSDAILALTDRVITLDGGQISG
jgi:ATP-binding cassette, subfamily C, bacterial CydD